VLYELYTGKIMFEGADNNDMLRLQMELNGLISKKLLRKSIFASEHFDSNGLFERTRVDLVSGIEIQEKYQIKVKRNILDDLKSSSGVMTAEQFKKVRLLSNLISRCVELDPGKRITPDECLKHAIFSSTSE
jgi:serine/threonine-protein kinase PRP4